MSRQQSLEQERARAAWVAIRSVSPNNKKEYLTIAKDAPTYIQTNGLGQTLSFWKAKKHFDIYNHVSTWVTQQLKTTKPDLLEWIIAEDTSSQLYRYATREAMAYLSWLKRFAQAEGD
jgi:CRISPR-associated protein Cmr5